jgi:hypothetical protein
MDETSTPHHIGDLDNLTVAEHRLPASDAGGPSHYSLDAGRGQVGPLDS